MMRILEFDVNGQSLKKKGNFSNIIRGTKGYLKCQFNTNIQDWGSCTKIGAIFTSGDDEEVMTLNSAGECMVPNSMTDYSSFKIQLIGINKRRNYQILTNKIVVQQIGSSFNKKI